jgi:hypothetical protein
MFDIAQVLTPLMIFVSYGLTAVLVAGAWWASGRAGLGLGERRATVAGLGLLLLAWQTGMTWLAQQGAFLNAPDRVGPQIALAIFIPVPIALGLIAMSPRLRRMVEAAPLSALVGVQFYRVLGAIFLALWWAGRLPGEFALPAGIGDVLVGLAALGVAGAIAHQAGNARRLAAVWNTLGALDLLVAVTTGFLTSPGLLQTFALDAPNRLVSALPLALVPLYAVPVSFILHALVWQRLRAERGRWNAAVAT